MSIWVGGRSTAQAQNIPRRQVQSANEELEEQLMMIKRQKVKTVAEAATECLGSARRKTDHPHGIQRSVVHGMRGRMVRKKVEQLALALAPFTGKQW